MLPWPPQLRPLRSLCQLQLGDRRVCFGFNISDPCFVNIYFLRSILSIQKKDTNARKISQNRNFAVFYIKTYQIGRNGWLNDAYHVITRFGPPSSHLHFLMGQCKHQSFVERGTSIVKVWKKKHFINKFIFIYYKFYKYLINMINNLNLIIC